MRKLSVISLVFMSLAFAQPVWAYIDPGTGSYLFQILIALAVGSLFSIKLFWKKIRTSFENLFKSKSDNTAE